MYPELPCFTSIINEKGSVLLRIYSVFWISYIYKYIYININVYNFTINQCIIIIVIPEMYEVIPFEKGLLYRKM